MGKFTLYELMNRYEIVIPQIQRDYAQGRKKHERLRLNFIAKIKEAISDGGKPLNLDFVYGYTEKKNEKQEAFIPLDGQQRLTTLWLLHWYLAPKVIVNTADGRAEVSLNEANKAWLKRFNYETRSSSSGFCKNLIDSPLVDGGGKLSDSIRDAPWFMSSWENDPTIISMLNMLDSIVSAGFVQDTAWLNLIDNKKITFDYIDIRDGEFKLTDELYIKMNSRGRALTDFENFKAQFSELLASPTTDYADEKLSYEETKLTYREYFAFKVDSVWMDLFWDFAKRKNVKVDDCFMNYFVYIDQMCFFKDNLKRNADDFNNDFSGFRKKDNVLFLFNTLDLLYNISREDSSGKVDTSLINDFFSKIFQASKIDKKTYANQVRLFENNGTNLFEKCLTEGSGFDNRNRIILYCVLAFSVKYELLSPNEQLKDFVRVVRNLLQATRQKHETVYRTNVRINLFGQYMKLFAQLMEQENVYGCLLNGVDNNATEISDNALQNEVKKAEIISKRADVKSALCQTEEFSYFGGLIHQLKPMENMDKLANYSCVVREIWKPENKDSLIIGAMIALGYEGLYTKNCRLGEMYFFGKKESGKWNTILTADNNPSLSASIVNLLDAYLTDQTSEYPQIKLQKIIDNYLSSKINKDWRYYFLQYPEMLSKTNYFAWESDFKIRRLGSDSSNPLIAYHINPYVSVVAKKLNDQICEERDCYAQYSYSSGLLLKNGVTLFCEDAGWRIDLGENYQLSSDIRQKFNIGDDMLLIESEDVDRIEIAVDFCNQL